MSSLSISLYQIILGLRLLRPLRLISLVPQMRRVIWDVILGWKKFLLGGVLLLLSIFMFASLGVQVSIAMHVCTLLYLRLMQLQSLKFGVS